MSHRFYTELEKELRETRNAELRGKLHPKRQIQYTSRVHTIIENWEIILFFAAVIGGYSFMVFLIIMAFLNGGPLLW